jgi:hypothetical protein
VDGGTHSSIRGVFRLSRWCTGTAPVAAVRFVADFAGGDVAARSGVADGDPHGGSRRHLQLPRDVDARCDESIFKNPDGTQKACGR